MAEATKIAFYSESWAKGNNAGAPHPYVHGIRASGYSRDGIVHDDRIVIGCQTIQRYELEQLALHLGPMSSFQVGAEIECVHCQNVPLTAGKKYVVLGVYDGNYVTVINDMGNKSNYWMSRFRIAIAVTPQELVDTFLVFAQAATKPRPLQVGDTVLDTFSRQPYVVDAIGTDGTSILGKTLHGKLCCLAVGRYTRTPPN